MDASVAETKYVAPKDTEIPQNLQVRNTQTVESDVITGPTGEEALCKALWTLYRAKYTAEYVYQNPVEEKSEYARFKSEIFEPYKELAKKLNTEGGYDATETAEIILDLEGKVREEFSKYFLSSGRTIPQVRKMAVAMALQAIKEDPKAIKRDK